MFAFIRGFEHLPDDSANLVALAADSPDTRAMLGGSAYTDVVV
jgi:hypothetical protein